RLAPCVLAAALAACGSDVSLGGPNTLVRVDSEPEGPNCASGGAAIHTGLDLDGDRFLDDDEITSTQLVCNGSPDVQGSGGPTSQGQIAPRSASALARPRGVTCIDGALLIAGTAAADLEPLADLHAITGDLVIAGNPALSSLDGLRNLQELGDTYL